MGEFRIGFKYARHSYPDPPRGGGVSPTSFARNFAVGPATDTDISITGTDVPWSAIDVGAPGVNVPITPIATGIAVISGVLTVKNTSGSDTLIVVVGVAVNNVLLAFPLAESTVIPINSTLAIPFLAEATGLALNAASNVQIVVTTPDQDGVGQIVGESSSVDVQEVAAATG
jgi:hypothetical protein